MNTQSFEGYLFTENWKNPFGLKEEIPQNGICVVSNTTSARNNNWVKELEAWDNKTEKNIKNNDWTFHKVRFGINWIDASWGYITISDPTGIKGLIDTEKYGIEYRKRSAEADFNVTAGHRFKEAMECFYQISDKYKSFEEFLADGNEFAK